MSSVLDVFRLIPPGMPGKTRLARILLRRSSTLSTVLVRDRFGFQYEVPDLRDPIAFHLAIDGEYERETMNVIHAYLSPGGVFVDVGANVGLFSIPAAQYAGPRGRVVAAEASPEVFSYLQRNVRANNCSQVDCLQCAVCASDGSVSFYPAPNEHFGMGSMGPQFNTEPIQVPARTLDGILEEKGIADVDVLKIDVEGFEAAVLKGAMRLLAGKCPPLIVFEFCDWAEARLPDGKMGAAQEFLFECGYSVWRLSDFLKGKDPLRESITSDYSMLVGFRR